MSTTLDLPQLDRPQLDRPQLDVPKLDGPQPRALGATAPEIPANENERIAALEGHRILDTLPEESYNRIVETAAEVCGTPIAAISLIDHERQWFKARVGLDATETSREISFCGHAVAADEELCVGDALKDERFAHNPLVAGDPKIRFYFGVPVHGGAGLALGTLCVIDRTPRDLDRTQRLVLRHLAREVETELKLRLSARELRRLLDRRSVLSSMAAHDAANLMNRTVVHLDDLTERLEGEDQEVASQALASAEQVIRLCRNFVELHREDDPPTIEPRILPADLAGWMDALGRRERRRAGIEGIFLAIDYSLERPVRLTDIDVLERIVVNLLDNAYRHSPQGCTVRLSLRPSPDGGFALEVEDEGDGVPEEIRESIFHAFFSDRGKSRRGAGLGLAFCRLACEALGGAISVDPSSRGGARFVVRLP